MSCLKINATELLRSRWSVEIVSTIRKNFKSLVICLFFYEKISKTSNETSILCVYASEGNPKVTENTSITYTKSISGGIENEIYNNY